MTMRIAAAAAAVTLAAATLAAPAVARQDDGASRTVMTRIDPDQALEALRDAGFRGTVTATEDRAVEIETRMSGVTVAVTLLGCKEGRQCSSIQLRITARLSHFGLASDQEGLSAAMTATNRWGHHRRYSTAYVYFSRNAQSHLVALAADHPFFGGSTHEAVVSSFRHFSDLAGEFRAFIRDPAHQVMPTG